MEHRRMGQSGLHVPELGLGTMTFGKETDEAEAERIVHRYLDAGGFLFDSADGYNGGLAEEYLGASLGSHRSEVVISTKVRFATGPGPNDRGASRRHILDNIEHSLRRMRTDWIDVYFIHCWDHRTGLQETLSALDRLVQSGKVRYLGASNFAAWQVAKAIGISERRCWEIFQVIQPQYSLICRSTERELLPLAESEGLGVLTWSPLGGGLLTGKYSFDGDLPSHTRAADSARRGSPTMRNRFTGKNQQIVEAVKKAAAGFGYQPAQVAISWLLRQPLVSSVLLGVRTQRQLESLLAAPGCQLPEVAWTELDAISEPAPEYPSDFIRYSSAV